ncbi:hypothetical protein ACVJGD_008433 [Bradyrhizobium sp. USDA 10063]
MQCSKCNADDWCEIASRDAWSSGWVISCNVCGEYAEHQLAERGFNDNQLRHARTLHRAGLSLTTAFCAIWIASVLLAVAIAVLFLWPLLKC